MRETGAKQRKEWIDSVTSGSNKCHRENERLGKVISSAVGSCFWRGGHCVTAPPDWQGRLFCPSPVLWRGGWKSRSSPWQMRLNRFKNFLYPLSCSKSRETGWGVETGMAEGHCLLMGLMTHMHFFELTVLFWAVMLLFMLLPFPRAALLLLSCFHCLLGRFFFKLILQNHGQAVSSFLRTFLDDSSSSAELTTLSFWG